MSRKACFQRSDRHGRFPAKDTHFRDTTLADGTAVSCLRPAEARVLDHHVNGYFSHGIELHDGATVVDVGANIGVFDIRVLQKWPSARVVACEPVPAIFKCLESNARRYGDGRFIPIECGISSRPGRAEFTYYPNSPALSTSYPEQWTPGALAKAVEASLRNPPEDLWYIRYVPKSAARWFAARMRRTAEIIECELRTISNLVAELRIHAIDLLKIDCEGAEYDCLAGIEKPDWNKVKQVVVEVHDVEDGLARIKARLREMGLNRLIVEQEAALEGTELFTVFARRIEGEM